MTSIEQLIGDLLFRHNCVIVPAFGGFVARHVSARVDFSTGKMHPPSKSLLFNKQLINNDGLLVTELAQRNGLSYDFAFTQVRDKVEAWRGQLRQGQRIELDRVGKLFLDEEQNLCFEQDRYFNLLLESFGLGQVHFLAEEDVHVAEHMLVTEETSTSLKPGHVIEVAKPIEALPISSHETVLRHLNPEEAAEDTSVSRRKIWRYVAAACILPIAFYSIWIPMKTNVLESGILSIQDFNPFHAPAASNYEKRIIELPESQVLDQNGLEDQIEHLNGNVQVYTYSFSEQLNIPVDLNRNGSNVEMESDNPNHTGKNTQHTPEVYSHATMHYIVGCFSDGGNAENLMRKLKAAGLNGSVVDVKNGLHRVSAGAATSEEALADIKSTADAAGFNGWILK